MERTAPPFPERELWFCKMSFAVCCSDLENLIARTEKEKGLGLLFVINKRGTRFVLEYRKDWNVPIADDAIQITFCPYCGSKLQLVT
jgi:hypothetical protein